MSVPSVRPDHGLASGSVEPLIVCPARRAISTTVSVPSLVRTPGEKTFLHPAVVEVCHELLASRR